MVCSPRIPGPLLMPPSRSIEMQFLVLGGYQERNVAVSNDGNASLLFSVKKEEPFSFIFVNESALSDVIVMPGEKHIFPVCVYGFWLFENDQKGSLYVESNDPDRSVVTIDVTATAIRRE